jgi:DEAD/DEAH box helicase
MPTCLPLRCPSQPASLRGPVLLPFVLTHLQRHVTPRLQTLAFVLPLLTLVVERLERRATASGAALRRGSSGGGGAAADAAGPAALVVAPSRELAMQTVRVAQSLLPQQAWPVVQQAIGGANIHRQVEALRGGRPLLVVGTPGRLAELSRMGVLRTHGAAALVLDEVDQLLCEQFRADLLRVAQHAGAKCPGGAQIVRFPSCFRSHPVACSSVSMRCCGYPGGATNAIACLHWHHASSDYEQAPFCADRRIRDS